MVFGIDVSKWQGSFNFIQAKKEGVTFAIIKAGGGDDGLYKDRKFETYYKEAKAAGINVGAYFFGNAKTLDDAKKEADKFISLLKGKQFEYPVYYDVEGNMLKVDKNTLTQIIYTFCERVEKAGYFSGFYTGEYAVNNNIDDNKLKRFTHWIAKWSTNKPNVKSGATVGVWQYGGETNHIRPNKIAGVVCDQDYSFIDFPTRIKELGLNGFSGTVKPTVDNVTVTAVGLNCRDLPSMDGNVIGAFKRGDKLTVISREFDGWYNVSGKNVSGKEITGYCNAKYLEG